MGLQMLSDETALIVANNLGKCYEIYEKPTDRLKQVLFGGADRSYFREFHALSDVSFQVHRGSSLGVIGRNGAGKSTLLQLITGTLEPTSGCVNVFGKVAAVLELGAGFNMEFSGRENIELYCNLLQMAPNVIRERYDKIVAFSELQQFIDQPIKTYSSGMVARLAFSVIAHVDADILIIDEALSVGDAAFSQKCMRFLHGFRENGTIFFVSHDLSAVKAFCDSAIWIDAGRVRSFGDSRTVCEAYTADIYPSNLTKSADGVQKNLSSTKENSSNVTESSIRTEKLVVSKKKSAGGKRPKLGSHQIEAFAFNTESNSFGTDGAEIISVMFLDDDGEVVSFCDGRADVTVVVRAMVKQDIGSPIIGFFIKDRLGQPLFGANTYLTYKSAPVSAVPGQVLEARFNFELPILLVGDYSITAAIADGSLESHQQLHWLHDAALFKVTGSTLDGVLVGIPMNGIDLRLTDR